MNHAMDELAKALRSRFPGSVTSIERPKNAKGVWWLDFSWGPHRAEVELHPDTGYGVSVNSDAGYGERSDEHYVSSATALARIVELIERGGHTEASAEQIVRALREAKQLTQAQMAKLLKVKQASVSRLEKRSDFHLSTLRNIVAHLGGSLEIRVVFPEGMIHILKYDSDPAAMESRSRPRSPKKKARRSPSNDRRRITPIRRVGVA